MDEPESGADATAPPVAAKKSVWSEKVWPVVRVAVFYPLSAILGNLAAIAVFTLLVDKLHVLDIQFHGKTLSSISPSGRVLGLCVIIAFNLVAVIAAWRLIERKRLTDMLWGFSRADVKPFTFGIAAGLAEVLLVFGTLVATGAIRVEAGLGDIAPRRMLVALAWLAASCVLAPLAEEAWNRGYLFQNVKRGWGVAAATTVSALLFGGLHLLNQNASALGAINIALGVVPFVLGMLAFRSLWFPIGWHAAWNFAQFFIVGLPNSGFGPAALGIDGATLLRSTPVGPALLTGGSFGMEASVVDTVVLLVATGAVAWLYGHLRRGREGAA